VKIVHIECLIGKCPAKWNWLAVRLNKHYPDRKPDSNIGESADLGLLPEDREKDGAGEEGRTPDLMLGKHGWKKRTV
jgi:hypothetical protein